LQYEFSMPTFTDVLSDTTLILCNTHDSVKYKKKNVNNCPRQRFVDCNKEIENKACVFHVCIFLVSLYDTAGII
jgi:hypothetical protein